MTTSFCASSPRGGRDQNTRRVRCAMLTAALSFAAMTSDVLAAPSLSPPAIIDTTGLAFATTEAFCRYHCTPTHVGVAFARRLDTSECDARVCAAYLDPTTTTTTTTGTRRLTSNTTNMNQTDDKNVTRVSFMSCQRVAQSATTLAFELNQQQHTTSVFTGFHDAFYAAFDAMITSPNATFDACQLTFLQQKLLPTSAIDDTNNVAASSFVNAASDNANNNNAPHAPMLVRLQRSTPDAQRACVEAIQAIWSTSDEAMTPFLSRQDATTHAATVMLVHVDTVVAEALADVACVDSVTELPAILKLMPFARSALTLSRAPTTEAPAMELRVAINSDPSIVLERLQSKLFRLHGVTNAFERPRDATTKPRVVHLRALSDVTTWSHAIALALLDPHVLWVDVQSELTQFTLRHPAYRQVLHPTDRRLDAYVASLVGVDAAKAQGIRGNDVIVGITDSGLYMDHDQFDQPSRQMYNKVDLAARKVVFYNAWANRFDESAELTCGHGTHVAGILAGASLSQKSRNFGIADAAKIAFMDIGAPQRSCAGQQGCPVTLATPADASDLLKSQMDVGAKIFSFSWGTLESDYSAQARDLDLFLYNNPDVLVVVAAGNSGEKSANGQQTISSPSGAKNVLSVGASLSTAASFTQFPCPNILNERSIASFSSAGPTTDGRLKPDVVAPGMIITSSKSEAPGSTLKTSDTCDLQGTSQATPVVTGLAVLLYEWLRDGWWKTGQKNPDYKMQTIPSALLKALIIHSGDALSKRLAPFETGAISCVGIERKAWNVAYPDVYQGYGKPNMSNLADFGTTNASNSAPTLYFLPNSTVGSEPRVAHGKSVVISFTVPRNVDLRATLVWTDPPGSVTAASMLQHDLDLTVQLRNGTKKFAPLTALGEPNGRDAKNNVEMVQVTYAQLLEAAMADINAATLVGTDGEIIVEAVIYGRSVLSKPTQAFAFVASSSGIGTAIGSAMSDPVGVLHSIWTPYTIGAIAVGALVLLVVIALIVRCHTRRRRRTGGGASGATSTGNYPGQSSVGPAAAVASSSSGQAYYAHATPPANDRRQGGCPYCPFVHNDPVVMVNHVEHLHAGGDQGQGGVPVMDGNLQLPVLSAASPLSPYQQPQQPQQPQQQHRGRRQPYQQHVRRIPDDERCPLCNFSSADPVILVNHVEHMHP